MATVPWGEEIAVVYDDMSADMFDDAVIRPTVDLLARLAGDGRALEFALGTGRVALPLSRLGVPVSGIELSPHMVDVFRGKPGAAAIDVTVGDMASTTVDGTFSLVYLVYNTIMNVTTQAEQVDVFRNAAAHLPSGGHFVIEVIVPQLRRVPVGETGRVFAMEPTHVGIETFDDPVAQISWSHHWFNVGGRFVHESSPYRYVWPAELDLMAQLAGMHLIERSDGWGKRPFTADSASHVSVYRRT